MALARSELWDVRLPLLTAVDWTAGGTEMEVPYLVVILHDTDGRRGAAEITCRPAWNGMTPGLLARAFEDLAWPRISRLSGQKTVADALSDIRGMTALKALCDNAWTDLMAPAKGEKSIRVASVLTRAEPEAMASRALQIREETGTNAFKVKLGQGIEKDMRAVSALRRALPDAELSGDANSNYGRNELPRLADMAFDMGLNFLEDPCPLHPDAATGAAIAALKLPVLADRNVSSSAIVDAFADRGINQVSAKPNRIGLSAALSVAQAARNRGGRVCNGTYSESALGAAAQIKFACALPDGLAHAHEIDFHRGLAEQIALCPIIRNGYASTGPGSLAERIDRSALNRFGTPWPELSNDKTRMRVHG